MRLTAAVALALFSVATAGAASAKPAQTKQQASAKQEAPQSKPQAPADALSQHVKILASDEFEGRAPGTKGEEKTVAYIADQMKKAGLQPGGPNGSWFQDVPFVETRADPTATLEVTTTRDTVRFQPRRDFVLWTMRSTPPTSLANSPLVFVGYGISAPERQWDDYARVDVRGKTVVILVNDPGSADPNLFDGNAMTYYGRWTYKFEEAARHGAAGALLIHETRTASYPWSVVVSSWAGAHLDLPPEADSDPRLAVEGWITTGMAQQLFRIAGQDFDALKAAAAKPGFRARPLDARVGIDLKPQLRSFTSKNVVGILRGSERSDEALLYTAHWDHFGVGKEGEIYHGALDNASGVAGLLSLAERFAHEKQKPRRSIIFLAVTGEEYNLLGSAWYARHPVIPLGTTVANVNMDVLASIGPTRDVVVTGAGKVPELETLLAKYAVAQDRHVEPDAHPESGGFFRSDQFNFAKAGVPVLAARSGFDSREHGRAWGETQRRDYTANRYHQPSDAWSPDIDWRGAVQDLDLYYQVGRELADGKAWPRWSERAEFARERNETEALRNPAEAKRIETKSPDVKAPEPKALELKSPERKAPEAKAPEHSVPEEKPPESKPPAATKPAVPNSPQPD
jgi:Zn-dependent M28 family amino/carboxypeptidase